MILRNITLLLKRKTNKNSKEVILCSQQVREGLRVIAVYANYSASAEQAVFLPFTGTSNQEGSGILWKSSKGLPSQFKQQQKKKQTTLKIDLSQAEFKNKIKSCGEESCN